MGFGDTKSFFCSIGFYIVAICSVFMLQYKEGVILCQKMQWCVPE